MGPNYIPLLLLPYSYFVPNTLLRALWKEIGFFFSVKDNNNYTFGAKLSNYF